MMFTERALAERMSKTLGRRCLVQISYDNLCDWWTIDVVADATSGDAVPAMRLHACPEDTLAFTEQQLMDRIIEHLVHGQSRFHPTWRAPAVGMELAISDRAPGDPIAGQAWLDSTTGKLAVWSGQGWLEMAPTPIALASANVMASANATGVQRMQHYEAEDEAKAARVAREHEEEAREIYEATRRRLRGA